MAMKAILDSIAGLADVVAKEYKLQTDGPHKGKYMLDVEAVGDIMLDDVGGLKRSLSAARSERDEASQRLRAFGETTPAQFAEMQEKIKKMATMTDSEKVTAQIEAAKQQLVQKHEGELKSLKETIGQRDAETADLLIRSEATRILAKMGAKGTLLLPHIAARTRVVRDESGRAKVIVLQPDGKNPEISRRPGNNNNMDIEELIEIMSKDETYAPAFPGTGASGTAGSGKGSSSGARGSSASGGSGGGGTGGGGGGDSGEGLDAVGRLAALRREQGALATVKDS